MSKITRHIESVEDNVQAQAPSQAADSVRRLNAEWSGVIGAAARRVGGTGFWSPGQGTAWPVGE